MEHSIEYVRAHPDEEWDKEELSILEGITPDDVLYLDLPHAIGDWDWASLTEVIGMTGIKEYPHLPWDIRVLLDYEDEYDYIFGNAIGRGDEEAWFIVSESIPMWVVRKYPNRPWEREGLSFNPELTQEDIDTLDMPNATGDWRLDEDDL